MPIYHWFVDLLGVPSVRLLGGRCSEGVLPLVGQVFSPYNSQVTYPGRPCVHLLIDLFNRPIVLHHLIT